MSLKKEEYLPRLIDKKIDDCKTVAEAKALKEEYKKLMQQPSDTPTPSPEKSEQNLVA